MTLTDTDTDTLACTYRILHSSRMSPDALLTVTAPGTVRMEIGTNADPVLLNGVPHRITMWYVVGADETVTVRHSAVDRTDDWHRKPSEAVYAMVYGDAAREAVRHVARDFHASALKRQARQDLDTARETLAQALQAQEAAVEAVVAAQARVNSLG